MLVRICFFEKFHPKTLASMLKQGRKHQKFEANMFFEFVPKRWSRVFTHKKMFSEVKTHFWYRKWLCTLFNIMSINLLLLLFEPMVFVVWKSNKYWNELKAQSENTNIFLLFFFFITHNFESIFRYSKGKESKQKRERFVRFQAKVKV